MMRNLFSGVVHLTFIAAGCNSKSAPPPDPKTRFRGVTLKVLLPQSETLRACIDDQRGEWAAQTGAQIELETVSVAELVSPQGSIPGSALAEQSSVTGDILIFPATEMANVVAAGHATKIPKDVFGAEDYEHGDIARGVHDQIIMWDRQAYGVPVSAECMLIYYRLDLFADAARRQAFQEKYGRALEPPRTWQEFDQLAEYFGGQDLDGDNVPDHGVDISSPGEALLCRAVAYGKAPQNFSFLFDVNSFDPLTNEPAFQEAMQKWLDVLQFVATPTDEDRRLSKFSAGQAALALGSSQLAQQWLRAGVTGPGNKIGGLVACAPLPASVRVYQHDKRSWVDLPADKPNRAAILNGLVGAVPKTCPHPDVAFAFLSFLTSRERSLPYVTTPAYGLGPYRMSHVIDTAAWSASGWTASGTASFLSALRESLNEANVVAMLRIDSSERYHQLLERAAGAAFRGDKSGTQVLTELAESWQGITEQRGRDRQRRSYRYSLGMPVLN